MFLQTRRDSPALWRTRTNGCCDGALPRGLSDPNYVYSETQNFGFMRSDNAVSCCAPRRRASGCGKPQFTLFIAPFSMDPNTPQVLSARQTHLENHINRGRLGEDRFHRITRDMFGIDIGQGEFGRSSGRLLEAARSPLRQTPQS